MPRGSKEACTGKQKRKATPVEESCKQDGLSGAEVEGRTRATVNKLAGGGNQSGSSRVDA